MDNNRNIEKDSEMESNTGNSPSIHVGPGIREDIQKKNCRFGENFIIYLTPFPPYLKSEKQKNEILACLRPPLPPG